MRLLALRGSNLASLRDFDIDLAAGPLFEAGIFAITGPTGAGKSTLLDAICLALYDRTPRLGARGGVKVGAAGALDRLAANDVRGLLRRGAGRGHAEVDFVGRDGRRYRARWSLRRARNKPDGRFQKQSVAFEDLDAGVALGSDKKTETLRLIEAAIGLSFDQFRRSVLLAQNEFDAFLRAPARERGELLERMTGTDIYGRLSQAAHRSAAEAREALEALQRDLETTPVLDAAGRLRLEAEQVEATRWIAAAEGRGEALAQMGRWFAERDELREAEAEARKAKEVAEAAWEEAQPLRAEVEALQAVEPLRAVLAERDRCDEEAALEAERLVEREQAATRARDSEATYAEALAAGEARLAEAKAAADTMREEIEAARSLDLRLFEARKQEGDARNRAKEAAIQAGQSRMAAESRASGFRKAEKRRAEAEAWLEAHAAEAELATQWARWEALFDELEVARRGLSDARHAERALAQELEEAGAAAVGAEAALAGAQFELDQARAKAEAAEVESVQASPSEAQGHSDNLDALRRKVDGLRDRAGRARGLAQELEQARQQRKEARGERNRQRRRLRESAPKLEVVEAQLAEAERALERIEAAGQLEALRAKLQPGDPCPLCGATEHPGVGHEEGLVRAQGDRVETLRRQARELEAGQAAARAAEDAASRRVADAEQVLAQRGQALEAAKGEWEVSRMALGSVSVPADPLAPGTEAALSSTLEDLDDRQAKVRAEVERAGALEGLRRQAHEAVERAVGEVDQLRVAREAAAVVLAEVRSAARSNQGKREGVGARCEEVRASLAAALRGVVSTEALSEAPAQVRAAALERVEAWRAKAAEREEAAKAVEGHAPEVARLRERAAQLDAASGVLREERRALGAGVERLAAARATMLEGEHTETVEARVRKAARQAEGSVKRTRQFLASAREAASSAAALLAETRRSEASTRKEAEAARLDAEQALSAAGYAEAEVRERLQRPPEWLSERVGELEALRAALGEAAAVLQARVADLEAFDAQPAPDLEAEAVEVARARVRRAQHAFRTQAARLELRASEDAAARARHAALLPELESAQAVWTLRAQLDALIGSADGTRFREFAQSLTLDSVVAHANQHLARLAPRYRLQRVPGEDLALQVVDHDMGREIRGVQSLSGGESFLVSLALALGLASISARDTRVDSLFIDEGFGSLDPDTLDVVLTTLDALHASGRQVGLISHVGGLAERIGAQVRVEPSAPGVSAVTVSDGRLSDGRS